jgi:transposase-like protein
MIRTKRSDKCHVCQHPDRLDIDRAIVQGSNRASISRQYGISEQSLMNHERKHLSHQLAAAWQGKQEGESLDLLREIETLLQKSKAILEKAEQDEKYALALSAIRESRGVIELMINVSFSLHQVRMLELQIEREKSGEAGREREAVFEGQLAILTDSELALWERLVRKIQNQTHEEIAIDPEPFVPPRTERKHRFVHEEQDEEAPKSGQETGEPVGGSPKPLSMPKPIEIPKADSRRLMKELKLI